MWTYVIRHRELLRAIYRRSRPLTAAELVEFEADDQSCSTALTSSSVEASASRSRTLPTLSRASFSE